MNKNMFMMMVMGLMIGLVYGVGVMIKVVEDDGVSKWDMILVFIFFVVCYVVVEDIFVFILFGILVWLFFLICVIIVVLLIMVIVYMWKKWKFLVVGKEVI